MPHPDDFEFSYVLAAKDWHAAGSVAQVWHPLFLTRGSFLPETPTKAQGVFDTKIHFVTSKPTQCR